MKKDYGYLRDMLEVCPDGAWNRMLGFPGFKDKCEKARETGKYEELDWAVGFALEVSKRGPRWDTEKNRKAVLEQFGSCLVSELQKNGPTSTCFDGYGTTSRNGTKFYNLRVNTSAVLRQEKIARSPFYRALKECKTGFQRYAAEVLKERTGEELGLFGTIPLPPHGTR